MAVSRGQASPYVLSVIIAIATLLRHDHGVYIALSMALAVCLGPRPLQALLKVGAGALVLLSPWLLWVQVTEGVVSYLTSRVAFAQDNGLRSARPFGFIPPYLWSDNAARWLWHVAAFTSVASLIMSIRRRSIPVIVLAGMSVVASVALMRKDGQVGEVAAMWVPLFVWLVRESPNVGRAALACVGVVSIAAVVTVTRATEELPQIAREGGGLLRRAQSAVQFHMITPAIDAYAPPGETSDGRLIIHYLYECLRPSDRVWETAMWFPVTYYAQRRPVWHYHWDLGLKHDAAAQRQFLTWIAQQQAPVIITHSSDDLLKPFRSYPLVRRYVMTHYREMSSTRFEEYRAMGNKLRLLADIRRVPSGRFEPLDLPCFAE